MECFGDNLLVQKLGYVKDDNHSSIGEVANRMRTKYSNERVLGIIDNNVPQDQTPRYFDNFYEIKRIHAVHFLRHKTEDRYLIRINIDFEDFLMRIEKESKVKPFAPTRSKLESITKDQNIDLNKRFVKHIENLIKEEPSSIKFLTSCIEEARKAR